MTDVLVVGGGVAGLSAALAAHDAGASVHVVVKGALDETATALAQGGMAAMTAGSPWGQPRDSIALHTRDTLAAGAGLGDPAVVRSVVTASADAAARLEHHGVTFDRVAGPDSAWVQGLEAAHSVPRILHAGGDATGREIQRALSERVRRPEVHEKADQTPCIRISAYTLVTRLIQRGGRVTAVMTAPIHPDGALGPERVLPARAVVLATGGLGQLYPVTTNPPGATGDGVALGVAAGARIRDLEFVQFHPTAVANRTAPRDAATTFLISEAVRGEGAVLVDGHGVRFMPERDPRAELAPRDVVARAVAEVLAADRGGVFLDCSSVRVPTGGSRAAFLARRFPTIDRELRRRGIDWSRRPVPVAPAAHYAMGGIATDTAGRSSVPGLWAVGECACTGLHGANRLASNSLLEAAVFGHRAGHDAGHDAARSRPDGPPLHTAGSRYGEPPLDTAQRTLPDPADAFSRAALQEMMVREVGLSRTREGLEAASRRVVGWLAASSAAEPVRTVRAHEDRCLLAVAREVIRAAQAREESVGAHYRADERGHVRAQDKAPDVSTLGNDTERIVHAEPLGR